MVATLDDDSTQSSVSTAVLVATIVVLLLWLVLNIVGTVYFAKLKERQVEPGLEGFALASVVLGWLFMPIFNITSPIVYATSPPK